MPTDAPQQQTGRFNQLTAVIPAGQSLSDVINCSTGAPVMIFVPGNWTPSRMTFQISPDGANFYDLYDHNAVEVAFNVAAGTCISVDASWTPVIFFKVRSGSAELAVAQKENCSLIVTIDTKAEA